MQDWIIAFWHHPPYTKGSHNSDSLGDSNGRMVYIRENALPILEAGGVDLVLTGHSHSYERSYFLNGHYGYSGSFDSNTHVVQAGDGREDGDGAYQKCGTDGTVYIVAGSSGQATYGTFDHAANLVSFSRLGSLVIDVNNSRLDTRFLRENTGPTRIDDYLTIEFESCTGGDFAPTPDPITWATPPESSGIYSILMTATIASDPDGVEYYFECTAGGGNDRGWQDSNVYKNRGLSENTVYTYRVKARDKSPNQNETEWSDEVSARTDIDFPDPGDFNRDRVVDFLDFGLFGLQWTRNGCGLDDFWCGFTDMDQSTGVDAVDLSTFADHWLETFTGDSLPTKKHLVVLCAFDNHYYHDTDAVIADYGFDPSDYDILFNAADGDDVFAPGGSVRDYFKYNTYNQYTFGSTITTEWIKLPGDEVFYAGDFDAMVTDALGRLDERDIIDFSNFDDDDDLVVDFITFIFSGHDTYPDHDILSGWTSANGFSVSDYMIAPALKLSTTDRIIAPIGYFCHQLGQLLGLPNLYDEDFSSMGIGHWGLMGTPLGQGFGADGSPSAQYPPHLSAWSKVQLGIVEPFLINDPEVEDFWGTYRLGTGMTDLDRVGRVDFVIKPSELSNMEGIRTSPRYDAESLVHDLLGPGISLVPGTAKVTGSSDAIGIFRAGSSAGIGIGAGIIMSTGAVTDASGPNIKPDTSTGHGGSGDGDLDTLSQLATRDAVVLEFDIEFEAGSTGDLYLSFVFGSEEYLEFTGVGDYSGSTYLDHDVMAVFVDDGINPAINIAEVPDPDDPGGTTMVPVNVSTVNPGIPAAVPPDPNFPEQPAKNGSLYVDNAYDLDQTNSPYNIEYDGFTTVMEAHATRDPGVQHHIKIVIGDAGNGDDLYDSVIFLQNGSLSDLPGQFKIPVTEYLLIENRKPAGSEINIPQGGLAIWHIDEFKYNNNDEGYPGHSVMIPDPDPNLPPTEVQWPENDSHYMVALIQADNNYDLENNINGGDSGDLYRWPDDPNYINSTTEPATDAYQFGVLFDTFISILDISEPGDPMSFFIMDRTVYADDCGRAIPLEQSIEDPNVYVVYDCRSPWGSDDLCTTVNSASTPDGENDYTSSCAGEDPYDAWHSLTPQITGGYTISLHHDETNFDTTLAVFESCDDIVNGIESIACNDDSPWEGQELYHKSKVSLSLEEGVTYYVRVAGYNDDVGEYVITATYIPPLTNDDCDGAHTGEITDGLPYNGSMVTALPIPDPANPNIDFVTPGESWNDNVDVWHAFSPNTTRTVTITLSSFEFDTTLGVYGNDCEALHNQLLASNNDCADAPENQCDDSDDTDSKLSMEMIGGELYLIRVAGVNGSSGDYILLINNTFTDTAPPTPDPMEWLTLPHTTGTTSISMTAATASDDLNDVEYYFVCTSGGGNNSEWQSSSTYDDTGLTTDTEYTYKVQARDTSPNLNETGFSSEESATTGLPDTTPPTPDPMTWATPPESSGSYSILMTAATASDPSDVEYFFECTAGGGNDSDWQDSNVYKAKGLSEDTVYTYRVKARDKSLNQNETGWSDEMSARTDIDFPDPGDFNHDGIVNFLDLGLFALQWGRSGCNVEDFWCSFADMDQSTDVDAGDLWIFAYHWLEGFTIDIAFDTFDSYPDGTRVADLPDWYAGDSSSEVQSIGIGGSQGFTPDSTVFTWSAGDGSINGFNWSDLETGDAVVLSMDFEFTDGFEDDAVGWIIGPDSTMLRDYFRVRLWRIGLLGNRYGIEGYWYKAESETGYATVTIAEVSDTLTTGSWYRLRAEFTRLTATSVSIDAEVWLLDAAGAEMRKIAVGSIADTSALGSKAPHTKFFKNNVWPAFRNDAGNDGACDNAYYGFMPTTH